MSSSETLYLKIEKNTLVKNRVVHLSDIATMIGNSEPIVRQLKQMEIYSFSDDKNAKNQQQQVFSIMKIIQMIQQKYPYVKVINIGETDFVLEYLKKGEPPIWMDVAKTIVLCIVIFFGAAFTIMSFNNDVGVSDVLKMLYKQIMGKESNGFTEIEIFYSIGLAVGVIGFFNHFGKKKITPDPTPIQIEMRKYEKDSDDAFIENAGRGGRSIDAD